MTASRALAALVLVCAGPWCGAARAQDAGFPTGEGRAVTALSYSRDVLDEYRVGSQPVALGGDLVRESVSFYGSYGFTDRLDVSASAAWASSELGGDSTEPDQEGLQDLYTQLRWQAWSEPAGPGVLSVVLAPGLKLPLSGYDTSSLTAIGDAQVDLLGRVVVQYWLDAGPYVALETGYDHRFGEPADEVPLNLTVGWTLFDTLTLAPYYARVDSLGGDALVSVSGSAATLAQGSGPGSGAGGGQGGQSVGSSTFDLAAVEQDYETVGVGAYLRLSDRVGLSAGYRRTLGGRNTGDGEGVSVGLVLSY